MDHETRQRFSRIVGWVGFGLLVFWSFSYFQDRFPIKVKIHYLYKDIKNVEKLSRVMGELFTSEKKLQSRVTFFHKKPLSAGSKATRTQHLELAKDDYRLVVTLWFRDGDRRRLEQMLSLKQEGRATIYLHYAKALPRKGARP